MKVTSLYNNETYEWLVMARDPEKPDKIIDTNQYLIKEKNRALLLDPGGIEIFSSVLAATLTQTKLEHITDIFGSHQDPDIVSSLGLWNEVLPKLTLHAPWLWEGFLRHFNCSKLEYNPIPDEGKIITLDNSEFHAIPAHYLHASGNFHIYDPQAKILMSGDVGAALEAPGAPIFVENFDEHVEKMRFFHQRWMPSNDAKQDWIRRVRGLNIEIMAPQHGRLFRGDDVGRFLNWFERLDVGIALGRSGMI